MFEFEGRNYERYNYGDILPEATGIYLVTKGDSILYIGQAINFRTRHSSHEKENEFKRNLATHIYITKVSSSLLDEVEQKLISKVNPPLNEQHTK